MLKKLLIIMFIVSIISLSGCNQNTSQYEEIFKDFETQNLEGSNQTVPEDISPILIEGAESNLTEEDQEIVKIIDGELSNDDENVVVIDSVLPEVNNEVVKINSEKLEASESKEIAKTIKVMEGDLVSLNPKAQDPDGDRVTYTYSEAFIKNGFWQTNIGDAGKYLIEIVASDGELTASTEIIIEVLKANEAPVIECPSKTINLKETESYDLDCKIFDPEGDSFDVSYEGFSDDKVIKTGFDDAGSYTQIIRVIDNKGHERVYRVNVVVEDKNRAPELTEITKVIEIETGDIAVIDYDVSDADGDNVAVTISSPFNNQKTWQTTANDGGDYDVLVTANDGTDSVESIVKVKVNQRNRAPSLSTIGVIKVNEGDLIEIPQKALDNDGDELYYSVEGWFNDMTYQTNYDDAGEHTVTVTVSDGSKSTSQQVTIIVENSNRPPVFVVPA